MNRLPGKALALLQPKPNPNRGDTIFDIHQYCVPLPAFTLVEDAYLGFRISFTTG